MTYLSNIKRLNLTGNLGGLVTLMVARKSSISNIPVPVNGIIYGDITFIDDAGFVSWEVTTQSAGIGSRGELIREGLKNSKSLPFKLPKMRGDLFAQLELASQDEFIVLIKNANGKQFLFGSLEKPVLFEFDEDSGTNHSDLNHYSCRFNYIGPNNMFEYQGDIPVAPAGPAPAVVKIGPTPETAVAVRSLAPGEELIILTDYDYSIYFGTP